MATDGVDLIRTTDAAVRSRIALRPNPELALVSSCLAATVGGHLSYDEIHDEASLLGTLIAIGRSLAPRDTALTAQEALLPAQIDMLLLLRRKARVDLDVTLLPVLTPLQDPRCAAVVGEARGAARPDGCRQQVSGCPSGLVGAGEGCSARSVATGSAVARVEGAGSV